MKPLDTGQTLVRQHGLGVARACARARVTTGAYRSSTTILSMLGSATRPSSAPAPAIAWAMNRPEVTTVDFHDRWPLRSPS